MAVVLFMEPEVKPMSWEEFCATKPPFSCAFDGYVRAAPKYDDDGPYANFDHHSEVSRMETRSACSQFRMAIHMRIFDRFSIDGQPHMNLHMRDNDPDNCTVKYLADNPHHVRGIVNSRVNRLIYMEDILDTTGGAYPMSEDLHDLRRIAWIYDPYFVFKQSGRLDTEKTAQAYTDVMDLVCERIQAFVDGKGRAQDLDTRFDLVKEFDGWSLVHEIGAQARTGMFSKGINAFVSCRRGAVGKYVYTLCKMTPYTRIKLLPIYDALNRVENPDNGTWGGSNIVGGSPQPHGSDLPPLEVARIFDENKYNKIIV